MMTHGTGLRGRRRGLMIALLGALVGALLGGILVSCTSLGAGAPTPGAATTTPTSAPPTAQPTGVPPTAPPPTAVPTEVAPTATPPLPSAPTSVPPTATAPLPTMAPAPTTAPARPIIGFNPKAGTPGTTVSVFGSGYVPGQSVAVRLGLPNPVGDVLASAVAGADGRWAATVIIPDRLPSGELIADGPFNLVAMDARNVALAAAPFDFMLPAGPTREAASQAVRDLLAAWAAGRDVRPFLAANLRAELDAGRPADQTLGLHPIALASYNVAAPLDRPSEVLFVPARLNYNGFSEDRTFELVVEGGRWRISGSAMAGTPGPAPAADELDAVRRFLAAVQADRSGRGALPYVGGQLRTSIERGEIRDIGGVLMEQNPFRTFTVDTIYARQDDEVFVLGNLYYGSLEGTPRIFIVSAREGSWRVFRVADPYGGQQPSDPAAFPGAAWRALASHDANGDGVNETVYYIPSRLRPQTTFGDSYLASSAVVAEQVIVAQPGAGGQQVVLLRVDATRGINADMLLLGYGDLRPAAFLLALDPGSSTYLNLLPLKADGFGLDDAIGINWNATAGGFRIVP